MGDILVYSRGSLSSLNKLRRNNDLSSPIGELHHQMLIEILCRVPCESVYRCKFVCKNWNILLSRPEFAASYLDHKRRSNYVVPIPESFTLLFRTDNKRDRDTDSSFITLSDDGKLLLPTFTLKFLPYRDARVVATFKDLVLCYNHTNTSTSTSTITTRSTTASEIRSYYICNPFTMQWLTLPPSPPVIPDRNKYWSALVYEDKYRFRVVMIARYPFINQDYDPHQSLELIIFCSESRQWEEIAVEVPASHICKSHYRNSEFEGGVICNKKIYFLYRALVWEFNPFSFDWRTFRLPSRDRRPWRIVETEGRVLLIKQYSFPLIAMQELVMHNSSSSSNEEGKDLWYRRSIDFTRFRIVDPVVFLGVHPTNMRLIYVRVRNRGLFSCNTNSDEMKPLCLQYPSSAFFWNTRLEILPSPTVLPV